MIGSSPQPKTQHFTSMKFLKLTLTALASAATLAVVAGVPLVLSPAKTAPDATTEAATVGGDHDHVHGTQPLGSPRANAARPETKVAAGMCSAHKSAMASCSMAQAGDSKMGCCSGAKAHTRH